MTVAGRCAHAMAPYEVAVAGPGLVVDEQGVCGLESEHSRIVLRSFSGRLLRVLSTCFCGGDVPLAAAGHWAGFVRFGTSPVAANRNEVQVDQLPSGHSVFRRPPAGSR
jgi:hypothetical protein